MVANHFYVSSSYLSDFANSAYWPQDEGVSQIHWIPYYSLSDVAKIDEWQVKSRYKLPTFALVKELHCSRVDGSLISPLPVMVERPVIVVNFKQSLYYDTMLQNLPSIGSTYCVISPEGQYISHSDPEKVGSYSPEELIYRDKSGMKLAFLDGKHILTCYMRSDLTEWTSIITIQVDELVKELIAARSIQFIVLVFCTAVMIIITCVVVRRITIPLRNLARAIDKLGKGDFNSKVPVESGDEIGIISCKFNDMNQRLDVLIRTNYETMLREQEAIIQALELQINPHFIYNTLNTINVISLNIGNDVISKLIVNLSMMLQYSLNRKNTSVRFREDMEWMKKYFYIMEIRFPDKFSVYYNIQPEIYDCIVPQMMLQQIVENSILHGFSEMRCGGVISISGWREENTVLFSVEDNGKGMDEATLLSVFQPSQNGRHIGCSNINQRIKLRYGDAYGITVTSVPDVRTKFIIHIPYQI